MVRTGLVPRTANRENLLYYPAMQQKRYITGSADTPKGGTL